MGVTGHVLIERLQRYAAALRVAGTDEAADIAWREFTAQMDRDTRVLDDLEWTMALARHCYEAGWHAGLSRAATLASRALTVDEVRRRDVEDEIEFGLA